MIKLVNEYNPKITFKFIENIWQGRDHRESEEAIKAVYRKEALPHSFTEVMFSKALKAYEIISSSNSVDEIKIKDIIKIYKPLLQMNEDDANLLLQLIDKIKVALNYDCHWLEHFLDIYRYCILCPTFKGYEIELGKLFSNYSLIVNHLPPVIMYCYSSEKMANIIRSGGDEEQLRKIMSLLIKRTNKFNKSHKVVPLVEIQQSIYEIQEELKNDYGITHLGIFGSYSRGEQNKFSDLDIVCEVRKDFQNIGNLREMIAARIKEVTGIDVDVMINDVTYDANQIPVDMFNEKINLF